MSPARLPADETSRRRIAEDLDATLFVEAAAGTGKTTALVSRISAVLARGRSTLDRVVALTFTEKAAGEMKLRLRAALEEGRSREAASDEERARFEAALGELEVARIGTIHAFCADLLHERPVEAGVDPAFEVLAEEEADRLLERAFDDWFERRVEDPPAGVRRLLARRAWGRWSRGPRDLLRGAARRLVEHRDFDAAWKRPPGFDREAALDAAFEALAELAPLAARAAEAGRGDDWLAKNLAQVARFVREHATLEAHRGRDHDALEADLRRFAGGRWRGERIGWHWKGWGEELAPGLTRAEVVARRDAALERTRAVLADADAEAAALVREELRPVVARYEALKAERGRLDFLDLLLGARDLIRRDAAVRRDFQERFTHFFVDELQDTDPLQVEILLLLAADDPEVDDPDRAVPRAGKLFLVGDPKQSIYRFRRADVAIYERLEERLVAAGAEVLQLSTSFRSVPALQETVNAAFAPVMTGAADRGQAEYVPLAPWRGERPEQPAFVALPVPRPYKDWGNRAQVTDKEIDASYPDAVAAFVAWLVRDSGWRVSERGDESVPVEPRHVAILFRRLRSRWGDVPGPYVRALEARRLPHVLVGGRSYHEREEVAALRAALAAVEWPDDQLAVYATLRGPFFAFSDDVLLAARHRLARLDGEPARPDALASLHPLRRLDAAARERLAPEEAEVVDALALLGRLHAGRNRRPIAETVGRLLAAVRAHAGIANWPAGEQALANCLRLQDRARRFERRGASSFRAFVERLAEEAERGVAEEAPVVEEGTEGVRMMTVHKAKGLEFPVVVLADPTCHATAPRPSHHADPERRLWAEPLAGCMPLDLAERAEEELAREAAEAVRVAYVAATRARDLLVAPALGDGAREEERPRWLHPLDEALYPEPDRRRLPAVAPGCPPFGRDTVLDRPRSSGLGSDDAVAPGLHRARGGSPVTWWDPATLELGLEPGTGLRRFELLEETPRPDEGDAEEGGAAEGRAGEGIRDHRRWAAERARRREAGSEPTLRVRPVTAIAAAGDAAAGGVEVVECEGRRPGRPAGRRFGTLVHAALATVDLAGGEREVAAAVAAQARLLGSPGEERRAAERAVAGALAHPLLTRAGASPSARRETPVLLRLDEDGELAEGVVDLAFREEEAEGGGWTVIDFKTDPELDPETRAAYEAQVRLYARAVAAATGEATRGVLLLV